MNLANTAPGRAPWGGPEWGISEWSMSEWLATAPAASAALSLQLSFDAPPQPHGWSWVSAPWDSSRHGAELAALLVSLQPVETCFLPVTEGPEPPPTSRPRRPSLRPFWSPRPWPSGRMPECPLFWPSFPCRNG